MSDSWKGAIVRHRDRRKGRVMAERRSRITKAHRLLVHWDDDTLTDHPASTVTMLAPPLHYREVVTGREATRADLLGPRWAFWPSALLVALSLTLLAAYLLFGAR